MTFLDILSRSRIPFHRTGDEVQLCCPFCESQRGEPDTRFCFSINIRKDVGHCWHADCNYKSRHATAAILRQLRIEASCDRAVDAEEILVEEQVTLPNDFQVLTAASTDELDQRAYGYLVQRGITPTQITRRKIGVSYCGRYAYRIIVPVWVHGKLKGIVARDFTGRQKPKYLNSRGDKYLYGFDPEQTTCVLVEGVFKALRIERTGKRAAALLGHSLTPTQLTQLRDSQCRRVILFPDPDKVGRKGVVTIADQLREEWQGEIQVVWPVTVPADEMRLAALAAVTAHPYSWKLQDALLQNKLSFTSPSP